jgi:N4-gp56 family major capsid protein
VLWTDLAAQTTALAEAADVDAIALADSTTSVTLVEQGAAVIPTAKVRATGFVNVDPDIADIVGFNAGISLDTLARTPMLAGTNVRYGRGGATDPTSRATVEHEDEIASEDVRFVVARLRAANVRTFDGNAYAGIIHPYVAKDLREETGGAGWSDPVNYSDAERRWNGEIGKYEGVRFMESPRAGVVVDGGTTNEDVYQTLIFGQEGMAKAYSSGGGYTGGAQPTIVVSDKADNLNRFRAVGWKWLGGYGRFREDALWRIESSSSMGS